jgi:hypothetical protein
MPAYKKNHSTSPSDPTSPHPSAPGLPSEQTFHQHLRELIRGATRIVMEEIMQDVSDGFKLTHFNGL